MKKLIAVILTAALLLSVCAFAAAETRTVKVGICNYVDDASLNQIVENINKALADCEAQGGVHFEILYQNCNADGSVMQQIISSFLSQKVDVMVAIATPVAMTMQAMTEDNPVPVVFAAVSDPVAAGVVDSLEAPGSNLTGTSDFLDTAAVFNLIFALNPDAATVALLYDNGQDASATPIREAKALLDAKGVAYREYTGTNVSEIMLAAEALASDKADAVFTPQDNTVMTAELSIYETLAEAGIPHYTGADSFALNGAFLGYGVDYANLGYETGLMVIDIAVNGADPAATPVKLFDNGTATINTETCAALGFDFDAISDAFAPYCTTLIGIATGEISG